MFVLIMERLSQACAWSKIEIEFLTNLGQGGASPRNAADNRGDDRWVRMAAMPSASQPL